MKIEIDPRRFGILGLIGALAVGLALVWSSGRRSTNPDDLSAPLNRPAQSERLPESVEGREAYRRGLQVFQAGRHGDAVREFRRVVDAEPRLPIARAYLGLALVREKEYAKALEQFEEEARLLPNPAFAHAHIADVHYARGDLPAAIASMEKAVSLQPDLAQIHFNLGMLYPQALQLGKGLASLDRYVALEPQNHYAQYLRGNLLYKLARLDDAESALGEAIRLSPRTGLYHYGLGQVHFKRRASPANTDLALAQFRLALELNAPEPAAVRYHLGLCYQRKQDWDSAARELRASTELAPEAWGAFYALADVLHKQGRAEEARKARARFTALRAREDSRMKRSFHAQEVERNPGSPEARFQLAAFLAEQGERAEASRVITAAAELASKAGANASLREKIARLRADLAGERSAR